MSIRSRVSVWFPSRHFLRDQTVLKFCWLFDSTLTISIGIGCIGCGSSLWFYCASSNHFIKVCNRTLARDELMMPGCDSFSVKGKSTRSEKRDIKYPHLCFSYRFNICLLLHYVWTHAYDFVERNPIFFFLFIGRSITGWNRGKISASQRWHMVCS